MEEEFYEINTKGLCLLCFKDCSSEETNLGSEKVSCATSFKMMLRYLKIDMKNLCKFPSYFLHSMNALVDIDTVITACTECSKVQTKFSQLFQEFERIRLELDNCVQSLYCGMTTGSKNQQQVREYQKRMSTRNPTRLFDAYVAERLRTEILRNCELKIDVSVPKVLVVPTDMAEDDLYSRGFNPLVASRVQNSPRHRIQSKLHVPSSTARPAIVSTQHTSVSKGTNENEDESTSTCNNLSPQTEVEGQWSAAENVIVKVEASMPVSGEDPLSIGIGSDSNILGHILRQPMPKSAKSNLVNYVENSEIMHMDKSSSVSHSHSCRVCGKCFPTANGLWGHWQVHTRGSKEISNHSGVGLFKTDKQRKKLKKCETCGKVVSNIQRHMKSHLHEREGPNVCSYCQREFSSYQHYRLHLVSVHTMEAFQKYLPPGSTEVSVQEVIKSILDTAKQIFKTDADGRSGIFTMVCPYCSKTAEKQNNLRTHVLHTHFDKVLMHFKRLKEDCQSHQLNFSADGHEFTATVDPMVDNESVIINPQSLLLSNVSYESEMDQDEQSQTLFDPLG
ncbi:unnamed protein product [Orchesella dallaii]|uniref:C2H2-type domain-containing protein n=1 Tax=Orchesella dallaii TaxID=48710 RepID=A0ABP1RZ99_9HEXA